MCQICNGLNSSISCQIVLRAPQSLELLAERFPWNCQEEKKKKKQNQKKKGKIQKFFLPLCYSFTDSFGLQERGTAWLGRSKPVLNVARVTFKKKLSELSQEKPLRSQLLPRLEKGEPWEEQTLSSE